MSVCAFYIKARVKRGGKKGNFSCLMVLVLFSPSAIQTKVINALCGQRKKNLSIIRQSNTKLCKINWMFASGHRIFQYLCCFPFLFLLVL